MNEPLVSIVLPVYNGERFIRMSIESVIGQTYKNWELIIVDDCSTDNTGEIIKEYESKDYRIRSVRHKKNMFLPQALNTGFSMAKGELFTWTSDDNMYLSNAINTLVTSLDKYDVDVVYGNEQPIDENGNSILEISNYIFDIDSIPICSAIGAYFIFKRNVFFDVNGYESKWFLIEDWQFWIKAYNYGFKFKKIDDCNYLYRISRFSLTSTKTLKIKKNALKLSRINCRENISNYSSEILARCYLKQIRWCYDMQDKSEGKKSFDMALKFNSNAAEILNPELLNWLMED